MRGDAFEGDSSAATILDKAPECRKSSNGTISAVFVTFILLKVTESHVGTIPCLHGGDVVLSRR